MPRSPPASLVGHAEEDHVAIQRRLLAPKLQHDMERCGHDSLVVRRAPGVQDAVLDLSSKWIEGPLVALHCHHVEVTEQQQRALATVALDPRYQARPAGRSLEYLRGEAFAVELLLEIARRQDLVALRLCGVELDQVDQRFQGFAFDGRPVRFGGGQHGGQQERGEQGPA